MEVKGQAGQQEGARGPDAILTPLAAQRNFNRLMLFSTALISSIKQDLKGGFSQLINNFGAINILKGRS